MQSNKKLNVKLTIEEDSKEPKSVDFNFDSAIINELERNHDVDGYKEIASAVSFELARLLKGGQTDL